MGWDFSTEPEFQKKLDWVEEFCREEIEPLDFVFPYAVRSKDPKIKAIVKGMQDQVKEQGLLGAVPRRGPRRTRSGPTQAGSHQRDSGPLRIGTSDLRRRRP